MPKHKDEHKYWVWWLWSRPKTWTLVISDFPQGVQSSEKNPLVRITMSREVVSTLYSRCTFACFVSQRGSAVTGGLVCAFSPLCINFLNLAAWDLLLVLSSESNLLACLTQAVVWLLGTLGTAGAGSCLGLCNKGTNRWNEGERKNRKKSAGINPRLVEIVCERPLRFLW